nr:hypothetical protein NG677_21265 [Methylobacterium sp. OTU13CASTA1]
MSLSPDHRTKLLRLRSTVAGLSVTLGFVRLQRALSRKYDPDQPREPAGGPSGGRWASNGGGQGTSGQSSSGAEETVTEDGSRVLSLRIRSQPHQDWDEQHTVIASDGTRTIFEMAGRTQTIRDGETGTILARSTLVNGRAEPEAFVQQTGASTLARASSRALYNAGAALLAALSVRKSRDGSAIFEAPASLYERRQGPDKPVVWVGLVEEQELRAACPRRGEVQVILDEAVDEVRASGGFKDAQDFGNKVHAVAARKITNLKDPNLVAEVSYVPGKSAAQPYGIRSSLRLDVLERSVPRTVCIHDHKTGESQISAVRATTIAEMIARNFPDTQRIIVTEMRPTR